jgi:acyl-CoA thioester hydrolase
MTKQRARRADYAMFVPIATRWMDNDVYGHINNVIYYSSGFLHIRTAPVIGLVVETQCRYLAPIAFPDDITCGLRCGRAGNTSVRYEVGIFRNDEDEASAEGYLVHVYVDRATQKTPTPLPENLRAALQRITLNPS